MLTAWTSWSDGPAPGLAVETLASPSTNDAELSSGLGLPDGPSANCSFALPRLPGAAWWWGGLRKINANSWARERSACRHTSAVADLGTIEVACPPPFTDARSKRMLAAASMSRILGAAKRTCKDALTGWSGLASSDATG
eukprot:scaffold196_cov371-Prasinococcus_capsulatus_cf.AAC.26